VMLPVSAPFHCSLMTPAGVRLAGELEGVAVAAPTIPVVRNVDGDVTRTAGDVRPFLLRQVASPVRWTDCVRRLAAEGATAFVEVGPGRVLSGLVRRILSDARGHSIEDPDGLEKTLAAVANGEASMSEAKRR
jgi:[acyl-carrier-protein] S-malonyltransferase